MQLLLSPPSPSPPECEIWMEIWFGNEAESRDKCQGLCGAALWNCPTRHPYGQKGKPASSAVFILALSYVLLDSSDEDIKVGRL